MQAVRAAKREVAAEVIAGRRTLLEAAAAFRALDEHNLEFHWDTFRLLPGGSDGERFCRMVLGYVENLLLLRPPREAEVVRARLAEELEAHLRQHGTVTLPPVVSTS